MKKIQILTMTGLFLLFGSISGLNAQEFMKSDAKIVKILADTTYMSATEVTFPPGYKSNSHTHAASFVYALTDGTLSVVYADGTTQEITLKAGEYFSGPPEGPHMTTNKGSKPLKFLLIEFKEHPYTNKKMK